MTTQSAPKKARAAKRYIYPMMASCEAGSKTLSAQMLNISTSGIQFALKEKIEVKTPVTLVWKDETYGDFRVTLLIAREVIRSDSQQYSYYYGAQYCNLTPQTKDTLLVLLKAFREKDKTEHSQKTQIMTPKSILDAIEGGKATVAGFIGGQTSVFDSIIGSIKDYEKKAFSGSD
jgi:hypothetical protein